MKSAWVKRIARPKQTLLHLDLDAILTTSFILLSVSINNKRHPENLYTFWYHQWMWPRYLEFTTFDNTSKRCKLAISHIDKAIFQNWALYFWQILRTSDFIGFIFICRCPNLYFHPANCPRSGQKWASGDLMWCRC